MIETFSAVAAITFAALTVIWERSNFLNTFLKMLFFSLAMWGAFDAATRLGYIIKL